MNRKILASAVALCIAMTFTACKSKTESPAGTSQPSATGEQAAQTSQVNWMSYTDGMKKAKETGKPVLIDFYTDWCHWCKELDKVTYADPQVSQMLNNEFIAIKVNAEGAAELEDKGIKMTEMSLAKVYDVQGFPTLIVMDAKGNRVEFDDGNSVMKVLNYVSPDQMKIVLGYVGSGSSQKMPFKEYLKNPQAPAGK